MPSSDKGLCRVTSLLSRDFALPFFRRFMSGVAEFHEEEDEIQFLYQTAQLVILLTRWSGLNNDHAILFI